MKDGAAIVKIIREGKLKAYRYGTSFLDVYWQHPGLPQGCYVFVFTALKQDFIEMRYSSEQWMPGKHLAKIYVPKIKILMEDLARELEG